MEVVAEVVLSVSLEALFKQLGSSDLLKFARQEQLLTQLKKWEKKLLEIHEVLNDAEEKQIKQKSVKAWLGDLRDLAYDMEDVLDEFSYEALRRKMISELADDDGESSSTSSKVCKFIPTCCSSSSSTATTTTFTPVGCMRNVKMGSKIKDITTRLEAVYAQKTDLGLDKVAAIAQSTIWERPLTTSLVYEPEVYGRDADKQTIIDMLLSDDPEPADQTNVSVIPIVGMGGMGKTTLARLVYDDAETAKNFNVKAWVCVSDQFDAARVTKTILNSMMTSTSTSRSISTHDTLDFNQIQEKLREELKGKKFLLILDDMWNDNYGDWYCLQSPFLSGSRGSKIIVTTRNRRVAIMMGGEKNLHELERLSNDECWLVFKKHAFGNSNIHEQSTLALMGKEIVKKCGGLPLAARALGGLLRHEKRHERWNGVLTSKIWELTESDIIPALRLSYNHLPSHLKRCFAYCAIFPKDYEYIKEELILLWMAEGFIEQSNDDEEMEDVGDKYFLELLSRSFFQLPSSNASFFVMHDLIDDLAKFVAGKTCLHLDDKLENDSQHFISESVRHSSFMRRTYEKSRKFKRFQKKTRLHTFISLPIFDIVSHYISDNVLKELIAGLCHLRVLSLNAYKISELPDSLGKLKHLRYLNLSGSGIQCLPDSIGNLFHLQTLRLIFCVRLSRLPITIGNLINLRHLHVFGINFKEMPSQIGKLKDLRYLSNFIVGVGENNGLNIKELGGMTGLGGELCISKLENVVNIEDARDAGLKFKHKLKGLTMMWSHCSDDASAAGGKERSKMVEHVLHSLQPHSSLECLNIQSYGGLAFPRWVSDASLLSKLVELRIENCEKCMSLPRLGQLRSLKCLRIGGMDGVKKVGAEFYGETIGSVSASAGKFFPSLETLHIQAMPEWEHWECPSSATESDSESESVSLFPSLHKLKIQDCPKLIKSLPTYLPCLTELSIHNCPNLESPLLRLPYVKELEVKKINEAMLRSGIDLSSVSKLTISKILGLAKLHEGFVQVLLWLQALEISDCKELTCLWDDDDDNGFGSKNLTCDTENLRHGHDQLVNLGLLGCNLRSLKIFGCGKVERLPNGWQKSLTCLEELDIRICPKLVSLPEVGFPPSLRRLTLYYCKGLKCLPDGMMLKTMENGNCSSSSSSLCVLEDLSIYECPALICFPKGQLPITLKTLSVGNCVNLSSLPEGMMHCNPIPTDNTMGMSMSMSMYICTLEELSVKSCPYLTSFPNGNLPTSLKELKISLCENLKCLPEGVMHQQQHSSNTTSTTFNGGALLQVLEISDCPSLAFFPRGQFPSSLKELNIRACEQLVPISEEMFHASSTNNSLRSLSIKSCPNLKALPDCLSDLSYIFISTCKNLELRAHDQFQNLTRLTSLTISDCENIKTPLSQWGLTRLPSLTCLSIAGIFPDATSFSDQDHHSDLLPTTLTSLKLMAFPNLESLASLSLQNLTSLEDLTISSCPKLPSMLPRKKRLPATLSQLHIFECPLLKRRYSKEEGKDWPKIAHIPYVRFDDRTPP